jgi:hypothetical protein
MDFNVGDRVAIKYTSGLRIWGEGVIETILPPKTKLPIVVRMSEYFAPELVGKPLAFRAEELEKSDEV